MAPHACCWTLVSVIGLGWGLVAVAAQAPQDAEATKVAALIEQLGSAEFAARERAQTELTQMGLVAFDALLDAQQHGDLEIALRAGHLVRAMRVRWTEEGDSQDVKRILREYDEAVDDTRQKLIQRLAALDATANLDPLCRLARFERADKLSKLAALYVLRGDLPADLAVRQERGQRVVQQLGGSQRVAAEWLRAYALFLSQSPDAPARWEELVNAELEALRRSAESSSRPMVMELLRWQVHMLMDLKRPDDAKQAMRRSDLLSDGSTQELLTLVDWMLDSQGGDVVIELSQELSASFADNLPLQYRLAEAYWLQGTKEKADELAAAALHAQEDKLDAHFAVAGQLELRGRFAWAEAEYRHVIKVAGKTEIPGLKAAFRLAEMWHDQLQDLPAAEVLQPIVDAMQQSKDLESLLSEQLGREPGGIRSRMHYFYAEHLAREEKYQEQQDRLRKGIEADPKDADVLIAMHRCALADDAWRDFTKEMIQAAAARFRREIQDQKQALEVAALEGGQEGLRGARDALASLYNQLAWLIGNTDGDAQEALRSSKKSLELRPGDPGLMDTLGRCYYSAGDLENAVKMQQEAVRVLPHSGQLQRQLDLFQQALKESRAERAP